MNKFRVATRAQHINRTALWRSVIAGLSRHGFTDRDVADMAHKGTLETIKDEPRLMSVNNLLSRGLPKEEIAELRPEVHPALYSEAFKAGVRPSELNGMMDRYNLAPVKSEQVHNDQYDRLEYRETHGGLEDLVSSIKSGATPEESIDAASRLNRLDGTLRREYQPILDEFRKEEPELPRTLPLQSRSWMVGQLSDRQRQKVRGLGGGSDEVQYARTNLAPLSDIASYEEIEDQGYENYDVSGDTEEEVPTRGRKKRVRPLTQVERINRGLQEAERVRQDTEAERRLHERLEPTEQEYLDNALSFRYYHPLKTYSDFRAVPGSTHQDFLHALNVCSSKWKSFNYRNKFDPKTSIPNLLGTFTSLRHSGASQEEATRVVKQASPASLELLRQSARSIPFHQLESAWDLAQDRQNNTVGADPLLHHELLKHYIRERVVNGKNHEDAINSAFFPTAVTPPKPKYRSPGPLVSPDQLFE